MALVEGSPKFTVHVLTPEVLKTLESLRVEQREAHRVSTAARVRYEELCQEIVGKDRNYQFSADGGALLSTDGKYK